jgi:Ni/Co efflux regulator RcnB
MKKLITGALTGLLLASAAAPALAQEGWRGGHGRVYGARGNQIPQTAHAQPAPQAQAAPQAAPAQSGRNWSRGGGEHGWRRGGDVQRNQAERHDRGGGDHDWNRGEARRALGQNHDRNWSHDQDRSRGQSGARTWDSNRQRAWDQNRSWNDHRDRDRSRDGRTWQGRDWSDRGRERPRYDRRYYPPIYHAQRRYHAPAYRIPYGYYDRDWVYGDILPGGWFGSDYWLDDWQDYGLPIPPAGYEWVRVGDDALLVDTFTGRVVQVVYDLFW